MSSFLKDFDIFHYKMLLTPHFELCYEPWGQMANI